MSEPKELRLEVVREKSGEWCVIYGQGKIPGHCGPPRIERLNEGVSRVVIEVSAHLGRLVAQQMAVPEYPAEPEVMSQLAGAARAMASAATELTLTLREARK